MSRMAGRLTADVKKRKCRKKKTYQSFLNFGPYFWKVLKERHPNLSLSVKTINVLNSFGTDMFYRIANEASIICKYMEHKTLSSTVVQTAVRLVLPPGLSQEATIKGTRAVVNYYMGRKEGDSDSYIKMNKKAGEKEVWGKCISKKTNKIYYWNAITGESYWEEHSAELLTRSDVKIIDYVNEMVKGKKIIYSPRHSEGKTRKNGAPNISPANTPFEPYFSNESVVEDDDDTEFADSLNAYHETCRSSPSVNSGSLGSYDKEDLKFNLNRNSLSLKSTVTDSIKDMNSESMSGATSATQSSKRPPPETKSLDNSTDAAKEKKVVHSTKHKKEVQRPSPYARNKTPIQDRKMKEKEELQKKLMLKEQRPSPYTRNKTPIQDRKMKEKEELQKKLLLRNSANGSLIQPVTGENKASESKTSQPLALENKAKLNSNFKIPKYKSTPIQESALRTSDEWDPSPVLPKMSPPVSLRPIVQKPTSDKATSRTSDEWDSSSVLPKTLPRIIRNPIIRRPTHDRGPENDLHKLKLVPHQVENIINDWDQSEDGSEAQEEKTTNQIISPSSHNLPTNFKIKDMNEVTNRSRNSDRDSCCSSTVSLRKRVNDTDLEDLAIHPAKRNNNYLQSSNVSSTETASSTISRPPMNASTSIKQPMTANPNREEDTSSSAVAISSTSGPLRKALPDNPLDARHKLQQRRMQNGVNKPQCLKQNDGSMEWGDIGDKEEMECRDIEDKEEMEWEDIDDQEQTSSLNGTHEPNPSSRQCNSSILGSIPYKPFVVVCDTNIMIHRGDLLNELVGKKTILGVPVTVVVPYQVIRELDCIKMKDSHSTEAVKKLARDATRLIHSQLTENGSNLVMQDSSKHKKKAEPHLLLENNDDHVINCALQEKKEAGDSKLVVLLTDDKNMFINAFNHSLEVLEGSAFKKYVRNYKEKVLMLHQRLTTKPNPTNMNSVASSHQAEKKIVFDDDFLEKRSAIVSKSRAGCDVDELNYDLKDFLQKIIVTGNQRVYGDLTDYACNPLPNWSLIDYLSNVVKRWGHLTDSGLSQSTNANLRGLIQILKKNNKGKECFTVNDLRTYFTCCQGLALELQQYYPDITEPFTTRLNMIWEEWEQKKLCHSKSVNVDDDLQPADLALQNIYNRMRTDFESWKDKVHEQEQSEKKDMQSPLKTFCSKIYKVLRVLREALEDNPQASLTITHKCIEDFYKSTTFFEAEQGAPLFFEMTHDNILALFKEDNLRLRAKDMLDKLTKLYMEVEDLIEELNSSDDDDFL